MVAKYLYAKELLGLYTANLEMSTEYKERLLLNQLVS